MKQNAETYGRRKLKEELQMFLDQSLKLGLHAVAGTAVLSHPKGSWKDVHDCIEYYRDVNGYKWIICV